MPHLSSQILFKGRGGLSGENLKRLLGALNRGPRYPYNNSSGTDPTITLPLWSAFQGFGGEAPLTQWHPITEGMLINAFEFYNKDSDTAIDWVKREEIKKGLRLIRQPLGGVKVLAMDDNRAPIPNFEQL